MCLNVVSKKKPRETGFGWKVFGMLNGGLYGDCFTIAKVRPIDKWLKEEDYRDAPQKQTIGTGEYGVRYPAGFHIFKRKKDAKEWDFPRCTQIYKVEYRKAHAQGEQRIELIGPPIYLDCIVAKEIKILPLKRGLA